MAALLYVRAVLNLVWVPYLGSSVLLGIRMCERKCLHLKACTEVKFDAVSLLCTTMADKTHRGQRVAVSKDQVMSKLLEKCSKEEAILFNRKHRPICVRRNIPAGKLPEYKKLLISPHVSTRKVNKWVLMDLHTLKFTHLRVNYGVYDVIYLPMSKSLLLAKKFQLVSTSLRLKKIRVLVDRLSVFNLAADSQQNLVFIGAYANPNCEIIRMTTNGSNRRSLLHLGSCVMKMDIDTKHKLVYLFQALELVSISYNGVRTFLANFDSEATAIRYGSATDSLYYVVKNILFEHKNNKTSFVGRLGFWSTVADLKIDSDHLYMTLVWHGEIHRAEISNTSNQKLISMGRNKWPGVQKLMMCLI